MAYIKENPYSMKNTISSIGLVTEELLRKIKLEIEGLNHVFSPSDLSYEAIMDIYRGEANRTATSDRTPYPILAFNRGPLLGQESLNKRVSNQKLIRENLDDDSVKDVLFPTMSYFDSEFTFFGSSIDEVNRFEITYNSFTGISGIRNLKLELPDLEGEYVYTVTWEPLTAFEASMNDNGWTSVSGQFRVEGMFFVYEGTAKIIKELNARINSVWGNPTDLENSEEVGNIEILS